MADEEWTVIDNAQGIHNLIAFIVSNGNPIKRIAITVSNNKHAGNIPLKQPRKEIPLVFSFTFQFLCSNQQNKHEIYQIFHVYFTDCQFQYILSRG